MKRPFIIAGGAFALATAGIMSTTFVTPLAAEAKAAVPRAQTATFAVENMTCATCPITVKKAMSGVKGVQSVKVDFDARKAVVEFDPKVTNPAEIAAASTNAGYPATTAR
ncbi:heavy metal-associated domain-containing protein [Sphingopyxis sp. SE2]|uniref:heavy-metal-associated domain-containing protein n=1 Tax=Sphingopyxis sp. SE2 TaxID=1586240 RepID=UPI0028C150E5|nr:heavy metal-associated domain-containing protein [Sphingopyxis sp. SE2]MDT7531457.1 heavy metal-associated domain-containing protein [Sphingopyxis sp. SE2]